MHKPKLISYKHIASDLESLRSKQQSSANISVEESLDKANKSLEKGNFTHSLYVLDMGIMANPDNLQLIKERAKVYILAKMYQDALENVEYLLELDKDNEEAKQAKELLHQRIRYTKLVTAHPLYS